MSEATEGLGTGQAGGGSAFGQVDQAIESEEDTVGILRLDHAVGVQEDPVAGLEMLLAGVAPAAAESEG
jgi:hypothetical protein